MTGASHESAAVANKRPENLFRISGKTFPLIVCLMRVAHGLWPSKTDAELASRTGVSDRTCRYWLTRKTEMSADSLAALLRSDDGLKFLEALMGDARPAWWRAFRRRAKIINLEAEIEELKRRIAEFAE